MAYMTRDKGSKYIEFWKNLNDFKYFSNNGCYDVRDNDPLMCLDKSVFKQLFPKQELPRKGSCKYVELRLYIPGER